jgi:hypothetical protein
MTDKYKRHKPAPSVLGDSWFLSRGETMIWFSRRKLVRLVLIMGMLTAIATSPLSDYVVEDQRDGEMSVGESKQISVHYSEAIRGQAFKLSIKFESQPRSRSMVFKIVSDSPNILAYLKTLPPASSQGCVSSAKGVSEPDSGKSDKPDAAATALISDAEAVDSYDPDASSDLLKSDTDAEPREIKCTRDSSFYALVSQYEIDPTICPKSGECVLKFLVNVEVVPGNARGREDSIRVPLRITASATRSGGAGFCEKRPKDFRSDAKVSIRFDE